MNCVFPGVGTILAGFWAGREYVRNNLLIGVLQSLSAILVVGWVWSILTGWAIFKRSKTEGKSGTHRIILVQDAGAASDANELVVLASCWQVGEIFTKFRKLVTKHERSKELFHGIVPDCFLFEDSRSSTYERRKKVIVGIFTKEVKQAIAGIMFENTYRKIRSWVG